jgi:lipopolysaccharide/colanic/teichoic acid biosynthesis glycosyltransferase
VKATSQIPQKSENPLSLVEPSQMQVGELLPSPIVDSQLASPADAKTPVDRMGVSRSSGPKTLPTPNTNLTSLVRRSMHAAVQWSGRLAVIVSTIVTFDIGAFAHQTFRGTFDADIRGASIFCCLMAAIAFLVGLPEGPTSRTQALIASGLTSLGSAATLLLLLTIAPGFLPRFFILFSPLVGTPLLFAAYVYSRRDDSKEQQRARVFVVALGNEIRRLDEQIALYPERSSSLAGKLILETVEEGSSGDLFQLAQSAGATIVVLSVAAQNSPTIMSDVRRLHGFGVRVRTLFGFYEQWLGKLPLEEISIMALMVDTSDTHRGVFGRVKRALDIVAGLAGSAALVLAIPFVFVGNKFANQGPLFFSQTRVGRHGRTIQIYKLRTMTVSQEKPIGRAANSGAWTEPGDPRVTRFGRVLRRLHLDELPQSFNILRGDLSLVGPRPEQPHYVEQLSAAFPLYPMRHDVRPGLTGWAQVKWPYGSTFADAEQKLQYDLFYVVHQGLRMDLITIGRTIRAIVFRGGR